MTIDFAAGLTLPSFFFLYSSSLCALSFSASSSSSSSDPKRSTSSSSSSSLFGALVLIGSSDASGPYAVKGLLGSPGSEENSDSKEAMCLYQR